MNAYSRQSICSFRRALLVASALATAVLASAGCAQAQAASTFQDGVITPPVLVHFVQAQSTQEARRARFQGFCIVRLTVDERGIPQNVRVSKPVGMGLDENAINAVKEERFRPAMQGGHPVASPFSMQVNFKPMP